MSLCSLYLLLFCFLFFPPPSQRPSTSFLYFPFLFFSPICSLLEKGSSLLRGLWCCALPLAGRLSRFSFGCCVRNEYLLPERVVNWAAHPLTGPLGDGGAALFQWIALLGWGSIFLCRSGRIGIHVTIRFSRGAPLRRDRSRSGFCGSTLSIRGSWVEPIGVVATRCL